MAKGRTLPIAIVFRRSGKRFERGAGVAHTISILTCSRVREWWAVFKRKMGVAVGRKKKPLPKGRGWCKHARQSQLVLPIGSWNIRAADTERGDGIRCHDRPPSRKRGNAAADELDAAVAHGDVDPARVRALCEAIVTSAHARLNLESGIRRGHREQVRRCPGRRSAGIR